MYGQRLSRRLRCLTAQTKRSLPIQRMDIWLRPAPVEEELNHRSARRTPVKEEQGEDLNKPDKGIKKLEQMKDMKLAMQKRANGPDTLGRIQNNDWQITARIKRNGKEKCAQRARGGEKRNLPPRGFKTRSPPDENGLRAENETVSGGDIDGDSVDGIGSGGDRRSKRLLQRKKEVYVFHFCATYIMKTDTFALLIGVKKGPKYAVAKAERLSGGQCTWNTGSYFLEPKKKVNM
ncbi:hypothetical protein DFH09DRAFT_1097513 [Mycena vulgaris]|nr:hypothetical protein DFH09DRAFT_1097513 [Mycena vulgaris]